MLTGLYAFGTLTVILVASQQPHRIDSPAMKRRHMLQSLALAPLALAAQPRAELAQPSALGRKFIVSDIEVHVVKVNARGNWVLVRTKAGNGLTGVGDASHGGSDADKLKYLKQFGDLLRGRSIFDIEGLRLAAEPIVLRNGTAAAICLSALEQSLWDIRGKLFGVPAYELFGGLLNRRIRNYANINRSTENRTPAGFARTAERAVKAGFDAIKMAPWDSLTKPLPDAARVEELVKIGIECGNAVRQIIGPKVDLLLDVHGRLDVARGLDLARRLEHLNLFWLEEVTPAKPLDYLAEINRAARMPTAGGESIYGVRGFLPYITAKAVDIVMPDVKYCGGMLELKKIAALAEAAGIPVSPHGPASPVGNLAAAHVCAGMPNFQILEHSFGEVPWRAEIVDPPEEMNGGYLTLSSRPGLGVNLNDKLLAKYRAN